MSRFPMEKNLFITLATGHKLYVTAHGPTYDLSFRTGMVTSVGRQDSQKFMEGEQSIACAEPMVVSGIESLEGSYYILKALGIKWVFFSFVELFWALGE